MTKRRLTHGAVARITTVARPPTSSGTAATLRCADKHDQRHRMPSGSLRAVGHGNAGQQPRRRYPARCRSCRAHRAELVAPQRRGGRQARRRRSANAPAAGAGYSSARHSSPRGQRSCCRHDLGGRRTCTNWPFRWLTNQRRCIAGICTAWRVERGRTACIFGVGRAATADLVAGSEVAHRHLRPRAKCAPMRSRRCSRCPAVSDCPRRRSLPSPGSSACPAPSAQPITRAPWPPDGAPAGEQPWCSPCSDKGLGHQGGADLLVGHPWRPRR